LSRDILNYYSKLFEIIISNYIVYNIIIKGNKNCGWLVHRWIKLGNKDSCLARDRSGKTNDRSCHTSTSRGISLISRPPATSEHSKNIRRDTQKEAGLRHRGAIWKCLPSVGGHLSPDSISGSLSSLPAALFSLALLLSPSLLRSLPRFLTQGALPTCQRYIFCRPTNRLAGNFEIGTLI